MRRRDKEKRSRIGGELVLAMRVPEIPAVGRVGFRYWNDLYFVLTTWCSSFPQYLQHWLSQFPVSEDDPEQEDPPQYGEGLLQLLVRVHVPVPDT